MALVFEGLGIVAGLSSLPLMFSHLSGRESHAALNNCGAILVLPLVFMVTLQFFRFFGRLKNSFLFEAETVRYLEGAGKWWIGLGIVQVVLQSIQASALSPNTLIITGGGGIFAGLIVFFIAWVFRAGMKLKQEQELTAMVYQLATKVACKNA
jgi:hypothetical protein